MKAFTRVARLNVILPIEEKARYEAAARKARAGNLSTWIRQALGEACDRLKVPEK